jgi:hypothetical protein
MCLIALIALIALYDRATSPADEDTMYFPAPD